MNTLEFAKLCNVSKRTLIHYDNIGLLAPSSVLENGYREYSVIQLQKMDTIKIFQKAGYSLSEIKKIFTLNPGEIEVYLQNARDMLQRKISEYEKISRYINNKVTMYEEYKKNGDQIIKGTYEIAANYVTQNDEEHFFSFLQDDYSEFSMINSENRIFIQKGDELVSICGYAFFIKIKSNVSNILPQIQQKIKEIKVKDPGKYFISIIPHALIEDSETAIIKVIIES